MKDIQREILNDLSTQRFQENVSRAFKKQISENNSRLSALESMSGEFKDVELTWTTGAIKTAAHNLGKIPTGWYIIDIYAGGTSNTYVWPTRISWDENNISLFMSSGYSVTLKIRVFA
jgi:hypothetical protein